MSYDVIIVNYNGEKILERTLESVYASDPRPNAVIVYDNASTDKSCEVIRRAFPQVDLMEGPKNIGFGPGNNAATARAASEFILFMNNDLILDRRCAAELMAALERDPEAAIVNPMIYGGWDLDRRDRIYSFGATINTAGFGYSLTDAGEDRADLSCFSGACLMARTSVMRENPFQPRYFLYYEEPELSVRLMRRGLRVARRGAACCWHYVNYSTKGQSPSGIAFRQYHGVKNRWFMIGRYWPWRLMPWALFANSGHLAYVLAFQLVHRQWKFLPLAWHAPMEWFAGVFRRGGAPRNPGWFRKLTRTPVSLYLALGREVFGLKKKSS
ncbi:MAG: glycosyltransferase family 2 protein [Candidatus Sumerlaeia bacterium]